MGCLPRVLEVPRVVDDTEVPRILWVKCATSVECKTIRMAVSTVKDNWAMLLKLCPEFYNHVCELIKLLGSSQRTWHDWVGLVPTLFMLISITVLMVTWILLMHVLQVVEHVIALKTSFLQKFTYIMHCYILDQNMGCLRVHSKYSLACHWLFYWPGMKDKIHWRVLWRRTRELGCFPVRMRVGLRQMSWALLINEDFRCLCFIWCSALKVLSM